jgi:hypothetical protein
MNTKFTVAKLCHVPAFFGADIIITVNECVANDALIAHAKRLALGGNWDFSKMTVKVVKMKTAKFLQTKVDI